MRLLNYENYNKVVTITVQKDFNESVTAIEAKLRMRIPQLQQKILKSWIDIDENEQVFVFVDKKK